MNGYCRETYRATRCIIMASLTLCIVFLYGCETLHPVKQGEPQAKTKEPARQKKPPGLGSISKNLAKGGPQPTVQKPGSKPGAPGPTKESPAAAIDRMKIPAELDAAAAVDVNDILEKNPIQENADILSTRLGKVAGARVVLVQANGDMKPRYHANHDEIIYVVKGKGILKLGEDRHRGAPGAVFILPRGTTYSLVTSENPFVAVVIEVPPADPKDTWNVRGK